MTESEMVKNFGMPASIAALPRDPKTKLPVPWFVEWIDGLPDFRVMDGRKLVAAVKERKCWICGDKIGSVCAFVIGPMCAINRISAEPPSHHDCAVFAARVCPFLSKPAMRRNEKNLPEGGIEPAGMAIKRNPGVSLVWVTNGYTVVPEGQGMLFSINTPVEMQWFREGRDAMLEEVLESVRTGLPILTASAETQGAEAVRELAAYIERGIRLIYSSFPEHGTAGREAAK